LRITHTLKIYYTKSQREEPVGSLATLKKVLSRFVRHRVFYEMSARQRLSRQLYSVKNNFTIGHFDIDGSIELVITLFDANNPAHSVEIVNPHALRIYDENPGKGLAIAFYAEEAGEFEVRYYLRDEGEDETAPERTALEHITLPQLMEYLHESLSADVVEVSESKRV
jgi:hypothetical protein